MLNVAVEPPCCQPPRLRTWGFGRDDTWGGWSLPLLPPPQLACSFQCTGSLSLCTGKSTRAGTDPSSSSGVVSWVTLQRAQIASANALPSALVGDCGHADTDPSTPPCLPRRTHPSHQPGGSSLLHVLSPPLFPCTGL